MPQQPDAFTGWANHAMLLVQAIHDGRIESKTVLGMTQEQLDAFIAKLRGELSDEIEEGKRLHE